MSYVEPYMMWSAGPRPRPLHCLGSAMRRVSYQGKWMWMCHWCKTKKKYVPAPKKQAKASTRKKRTR